MRRSASSCTSGLRVPAECVRTSWSERTRAGIQGQQAPAVFVAPVGVDGPRPARISQNEGCRRSSTREPSMAKTIRIGIDTSKSVFQLHAVDETEKPVLRKQLRRSQMLEFFSKLEPTKIGLEACGASHYWARELTGLG